MSQRSRRFLAAHEAATHPSLKDHQFSATALAAAPLAPTLAKAVDDTNKGYRFNAKAAATKPAQDEREQVAEATPGYLERSRERITGLTTQLVGWGRQHPVRAAVAAAALIAASGLLYRAINGKAGKVAAVATAARAVKTRVKRQVKALVKDRLGARGKRKALAASAAS